MSYRDEADKLTEAADTATRASAYARGENVRRQPTYADILDAAAAAEEHAKRLRMSAALIRKDDEEARRPKMPELDNEGRATVVFSRYLSGRDYGYAAVGWRQGRHVRWAVTSQGDQRFNWQGLLEFIGSANWSTLAVVTETVNIGPEPGMEPPIVETMGRYGRVVDSTPVTDPFDTVTGG